MAETAHKAMISVTVNGEARTLAAGSSIAAMLESIGLDPRKVAVERNLQVVPRSTLGEAVVSDGDRPNILVIWGDDIGITNLSCYSDGLMGYRTPNIDRIADEGMRFTDSYGEQSCTAGRSAFITGQSVFRTGLSKVGMPGMDVGLQKEDPTIAELLKQFIAHNRMMSGGFSIHGV